MQGGVRITFSGQKGWCRLKGEGEGGWNVHQTFLPHSFLPQRPHFQVPFGWQGDLEICNTQVQSVTSKKPNVWNCAMKNKKWRGNQQHIQQEEKYWFKLVAKSKGDNRREEGKWTKEQTENRKNTGKKDTEWLSTFHTLFSINGLGRKNM